MKWLRPMLALAFLVGCGSSDPPDTASALVPPPPEVVEATARPVPSPSAEPAYEFKMLEDTCPQDYKLSGLVYRYDPRLMRRSEARESNCRTNTGTPDASGPAVNAVCLADSSNAGLKYAYNPEEMSRREADEIHCGSLEARYEARRMGLQCQVVWDGSIYGELEDLVRPFLLHEMMRTLRAEFSPLVPYGSDGEIAPYELGDVLPLPEGTHDVVLVFADIDLYSGKVATRTAHGVAHSETCAAELLRIE